jgi:hypothetical protein
MDVTPRPSFDDFTILTKLTSRFNLFLTQSFLQGLYFDTATRRESTGARESSSFVFRFWREIARASAEGRTKRQSCTSQ